HVLVVEAGEDDGRKNELEVVFGDLGKGIVAVYDLALLRNFYGAVYRAGRAREYSLVRRAPSPAYCAAAPVKEPVPNAELVGDGFQEALCLVDLPPGAEYAAVLPAVGVADHN